VYYETRVVSGKRQFIVQFKNVRFDSSTRLGDDYNVTFQMVLHEGSNDIQFNYIKVYSRGKGNTVAGLENETGRIGIVYPGFDQEGFYENFYVRFTTHSLPVGGPPEAVTLISPSGIISDNTPLFEWTEERSATAYRLTIRGNTSVAFDLPADEVTADGQCAYRIPDALADGTYEWSIQPTNSSGSGPVSKMTFTVQTETSPTPPGPVDPGEDPVPVNGPHVLYFPYVTAEQGWRTEIFLVNASRVTTLRGTFEVYNQDGSAAAEPKELTIYPLQRKVFIIDGIQPKYAGLKGKGFALFRASGDSVVGCNRFFAFEKYSAMVPAVGSGALAEQGDLYACQVASNSMWSTEVDLVNTTGEGKTLRLVLADGMVEESRSLFLGPGQQAFVDVGAIFPEGAVSGASYLVVKDESLSKGGVVAMARITNTNTMEAYLLSDRTGAEQVFPQVVENRTWRTAIVLVNPSENDAQVTITAYDDAGMILGAEEVPVEARSKYTTYPGALGFPSGVSWLAVVSDQELADGLELFANTGATLLSGSRSLRLEGTSGILPLLNDTAVTGISILNAQEIPAEITLTLYSNDGLEVAVKGLTLAPGAKEVAFVNDDYFGTDVSSANYIRYASSEAVIALQVNAYGALLDSLNALGVDMPARELVVRISVNKSPQEDSDGSFVYYTKYPTLTFTGSAYDEEGVPVGDTAVFSWSSSLDGPLGQGMEVTAEQLSEGEHVITLEVVDGTGASGKASTTLPIKKHPFDEAWDF